MWKNGFAIILCTRSLATPAALMTNRAVTVLPPAWMANTPSCFSIAVTSERSITSAPFFTAVSAIAIASSHGLTIPALGAYRAAIAFSLTFGSISWSSLEFRIFIPGTPFSIPRSYSFSIVRQSSSEKASTSDPTGLNGTSSFSHSSWISLLPSTL